MRNCTLVLYFAISNAASSVRPIADVITAASDAAVNSMDVRFGDKFVSIATAKMTAISGVPDDTAFSTELDSTSGLIGYAVAFLPLKDDGDHDGPACLHAAVATTLTLSPDASLLWKWLVCFSPTVDDALNLLVEESQQCNLIGFFSIILIPSHPAVAGNLMSDKSLQGSISVKLPKFLAPVSSVHQCTPPFTVGESPCKRDSKEVLLEASASPHDVIEINSPSAVSHDSLTSIFIGAIESVPIFYGGVDATGVAHPPCGHALISTTMDCAETAAVIDGYHLHPGAQILFLGLHLGVTWQSFHANAPPIVPNQMIQPRTVVLHELIFCSGSLSIDTVVGATVGESFIADAAGILFIATAMCITSLVFVDLIQCTADAVCYIHIHSAVMATPHQSFFVSGYCCGHCLGIPIWLLSSCYSIFNCCGRCHQFLFHSGILCGELSMWPCCYLYCQCAPFCREELCFPSSFLDVSQCLSSCFTTRSYVFDVWASSLNSG